MSRRAGAPQDMYAVLASPATRGAALRVGRCTPRYVPKLQTGPVAVFPAIVFDTIFQK
jgi:hypothetical protein